MTNPTRRAPRALWLLAGLLSIACSAHPGESDFGAVESNEQTTRAIANWECTTSGGSEQISPTGSYYVTSFGCWLDSAGKHRGDPKDNCIPWCAGRTDDPCEGKTGKQCEEDLVWFAAGERRYGCGARLRVTNPKTSKAVVVVVVDRGPNCSIEKKVSYWVTDLSYPTTQYLFGGSKSADEEAEVQIAVVPATTPLGPVVVTEPEPQKQDAPADPQQSNACGNVSFEGECAGSTLRYCENGTIQEIACSSDGWTCGWSDANGYNDCVQTDPAQTQQEPPAQQDPPAQQEPACGGVSYEGECDGSVLRYCTQDNVVQDDCAAMGLACGWNAAAGYFDCLAPEPAQDPPASSCGAITSMGACDGAVLSYCDGGELVVADCADWAMVCSWNASASYYDCV